MDRFSIQSDDPCWAAYWQLAQGDLSGTIALLRQGAALHPLLQLELARMLDGTHAKFDLRIAGKMRGAPRRSGPASRARRDRQVRADWLAEKTANPRDRAKTIKGRLAVRHGLSDAEISRAIKRADAEEERLRRFMAAHGVAPKPRS